MRHPTGPSSNRSCASPPCSDADDLVKTPLPEVLSFMQQLWALVHALQSRSERMHSTLGVTAPHRLTLRIVELHPDISATELAAVLHLHPSTLTGILRRLEERGLVARAKDSSDSRRNVLVLTAAGRKVEAPSEDTVEGRVAKVLATYSAADIKRLEKLLVALADKLWKGVRVADLETRVIDALATRAGEDRWSLFVPLDDAFEQIAAGGIERLQRSR